MIHDREYSRSCVRAVRFPTADLRQMFHYMREREDVLIRDLSRSGDDEQEIALARLREVRAILTWMVTNLHHDQSSVLPLEERIAARKKQG